MVRTAAILAVAKKAPDTFRQRVLSKLIRQLRTTESKARTGSLLRSLAIWEATPKKAIPALERATKDSE